MPNLYATPEEIKIAIPDMFQAATTRYDAPLLRMCNDVSRFIDRWCRRTFHPRSEIRYFNGNGKTEIWINDVFSISKLEYSDDEGKTYAELAQSDNWHLARAGDWNHPGSYDQLVIDPKGTTIAVWPSGFKSLKLTGIWAYADERSEAWENSQDAIKDDPLAADSNTLTVTDIDGENLWGITPRIHAGQLLRIEDEFNEVTAAIAGETNTATIVRGRNGTTAAEHAKDKQIDIWRPPEPVKEAAMIMAVRQHQRALQGFADSRANVEIGEMFFLRKIDPEAQELLASYRRKRIPK